MEINPSTVRLWNVFFSYKICGTPSVQKVLREVFFPEKACGRYSVHRRTMEGYLLHIWKVYYSQITCGMSTFHLRYVERILCIESLWETFGPEMYSIHRRPAKCIFSYQIRGTGSIHEDGRSPVEDIRSTKYQWMFFYLHQAYRRFLKGLLSIGNQGKTFCLKESSIKSSAHGRPVESILSIEGLWNV